MIFTELQARINKANVLDFGTIFNQSIELFKKVWLQGLITIVLTMVLMIPFYLLMYLPLIALGILDPQSFEQGQDPDLIFMLPFFLFMLIFMFVAISISFGLKAAFYRICKQKDLGEIGTDDYFYFFKKPYLGQVVKLGAITLGISVLAMLLCGLPLIYAIVPVSLINVVFAFNPDMSASSIVKASFNLGNKKWLITFGLMIVAGILAEIVGLVMCFVGIFVTASFAYLPLYFVYKDSVGFEPDELDEIGKIEQL